jgi:carbonic anhydrase
MERILARTVLTLSVLFFGSEAFGQSPPTPDQVIVRLKQGNARYLTGLSEHKRIDVERRVETAKYGQKPLTTILGCSDSRVPPEIVFDQGFAEVFVVRVAGNVSGEDQLASIEYGTQYLGTPVLLVLGHSKCGAVEAAIAGKELLGSLPTLVAKIKPAVKKVQDGHPDLAQDKLLDQCVKQNVWNTIEEIFRKSPLIVERVRKHELKVVGAVRDIKTGKVEWLGEHPEQTQLISLVFR